MSCYRFKNNNFDTNKARRPAVPQPAAALKKIGDTSLDVHTNTVSHPGKPFLRPLAPSWKG
jgi:hypothetical protein